METQPKGDCPRCRADGPLQIVVRRPGREIVGFERRPDPVGPDGLRVWHVVSGPEAVLNHELAEAANRFVSALTRAFEAARPDHGTACAERRVHAPGREVREAAARAHGACREAIDVARSALPPAAEEWIQATLMRAEGALDEARRSDWRAYADGGDGDSPEGGGEEPPSSGEEAVA